MLCNSWEKNKKTEKMPHSSWLPVPISKARHMGTEELNKNLNKKTARSDANKFAKENEQQYYNLLKFEEGLRRI